MDKTSLKKIEEGIEKLTPEEQLELVEKLVHRIRENTGNISDRNWQDIFGTGKGLWDKDAQDYVEETRKDR